MRRLLIFLIALVGILSPAAAQARPMSDVSTNQIKFFYGIPNVSGENLIFDSAASGIEIVPISDVIISSSNGKLTIRMRGVAEVTNFQGYLGNNKEVTVYTLSGNNKHSPLWLATAGELIKIFGESIASTADPQKITATWVDKENVTHKVETTRKKGEKAVDQVSRHKELLDAYKDAFKPVKAGGG